MKHIREFSRACGGNSGVPDSARGVHAASLSANQSANYFVDAIFHTEAA